LRIPPFFDFTVFLLPFEVEHRATPRHGFDLAAVRWLPPKGRTRRPRRRDTGSVPLRRRWETLAAQGTRSGRTPILRPMPDISHPLSISGQRGFFLLVSQRDEHCLQMVSRENHPHFSLYTVKGLCPLPGPGLRLGGVCFGLVPHIFKHLLIDGGFFKNEFADRWGGGKFPNQSCAQHEIFHDLIQVLNSPPPCSLNRLGQT